METLFLVKNKTIVNSIVSSSINPKFLTQMALDGGYDEVIVQPKEKYSIGVGYILDDEGDFVPPSGPYPSWTFDKSIGSWEAPTPYPNDGFPYQWDESSLSWDLLEEPTQ